MTRLDLLCMLVAAGDIQFILFHTVWTREISILKKNPSSLQKFDLILATINSIIYYYCGSKSTFSSIDFVIFLGLLWLKNALQLLWFIRFIKLSCYWEYTTKPHPSISPSSDWVILSTLYENLCMVGSWGSEATPSATPFFKRAYKISHPPQL